MICAGESFSLQFVVKEMKGLSSISTSDLNNVRFKSAILFRKDV